MRFRYELAERLGYRTVEELDRTMDAPEYQQWRILEEVRIEESESEDGRASAKPPKKLATSTAEIAQWFGRNT